MTRPCSGRGLARATALGLVLTLAACGVEPSGSGPAASTTTAVPSLAERPTFTRMADLLPDNDDVRDQWIVINLWTRIEASAPPYPAPEDPSDFEPGRLAYYQASYESGVEAPPTGFTPQFRGDPTRFGVKPSTITADLSVTDPEPDMGTLKTAYDVAVAPFDREAVFTEALRNEGATRTKVEGIPVVRWMTDEKDFLDGEGFRRGLPFRVGAFDHYLGVASTDEGIEALAKVANGTGKSIGDDPAVAAVTHRLDADEVYAAVLRAVPKAAKRDQGIYTDVRAIGMGGRVVGDRGASTLVIASGSPAAAKANADLVKQRLATGTDPISKERYSRFYSKVTVEVVDDTVAVARFESFSSDPFVRWFYGKDPLLGFPEK